RFRRLARAYEKLPQTLAGLHYVAFAMLMLPHLPDVVGMVQNMLYAALDCPAAPAPEQRAFDTCQHFDAAYVELSAKYPALCIKPAISVYGIGFRRIRTDRDAYDILSSGMDHQINLDSLRTLLAARPRIAPMLLMEYLDGQEYSVDCLAEHGTLHCAIARRKPLSPGEGQIIDGQENIQLACRKITSQFGLNGYVNIQFRQGSTGLRTLEVNPRLSGGVAMACLAGPNLPYLGLCGFLDGYAALKIPPIVEGLRVGEINQAIILP
ncbi:ATP-grasp domain-containing protein, partial [Rivihabitans pingtungensis]